MATVCKLHISSRHGSPLLGKLLLKGVIHRYQSQAYILNHACSASRKPSRIKEPKEQVKSQRWKGQNETQNEVWMELRVNNYRQKWASQLHNLYFKKFRQGKKNACPDRIKNSMKEDWIPKQWPETQRKFKHNEVQEGKVKYLGRSWKKHANTTTTTIKTFSYFLNFFLIKKI